MIVATEAAPLPQGPGCCMGERGLSNLGDRSGPPCRTRFPSAVLAVLAVLGRHRPGPSRPPSGARRCVANAGGEGCPRSGGERCTQSGGRKCTRSATRQWRASPAGACPASAEPTDREGTLPARSRHGLPQVERTCPGGRWTPSSRSPSTSWAEHDSSDPAPRLRRLPPRAPRQPRARHRAHTVTPTTVLPCHPLWT